MIDHCRFRQVATINSDKTGRNDGRPGTWPLGQVAVTHKIRLTKV